MNNRIFFAIITLALITTGAFAEDKRGKSSDYDENKTRTTLGCDTITQRETGTGRYDGVNLRKGDDRRDDERKDDRNYKSGGKDCTPKPPVCPPTPPVCPPVKPPCPPQGPPRHGDNNNCQTVPEPASMTAMVAGIAAMLKRKFAG